MSFNETLADRVRRALKDGNQISERKMFGGIAFFHRGNMFSGVLGDDLVVRIGPERAAQMGNWPHARPMDFTGRPMRGYLYVGPKATTSPQSLKRWLNEALSFAASLPAKAPAQSSGRRAKRSDRK